jgi:hypothetical protein
VQAFHHLLPGEPGLAERLVFRYEEITTDEPPARRPAAVDDKQENRQQRVRAQLKTCPLDAAVGNAAPPQNGCAQHDDAGTDGPRFVPRHAGRHHGQPSRSRWEGRAAIKPCRRERDADQRRTEEHRLGHRRRLEVKHVGICEQKEAAQDCREL